MSADTTPSDAPPAEEDWSQWVGRVETCDDLISEERVAALAATLDIDQTWRAGEVLPAGWHWVFFNRMVKRRDIGFDGHPKRGGFLPPITLPRRMWAGSRIVYEGNIVIGEVCTRTSVISKVQAKKGRGGDLVFVTVTHTIRCRGHDCLVEEQDIVYREPPAPNARPAPLTPAPQGAEWREDITPDTVLLFRYSALTYNGHRIHYDQPFAREQEGYPDLVVHGPLTATLLQHFATAWLSGHRLKRFEFRGVHPLFVNAPFSLEATKEGDNALKMWARGPQGELAMQASAELE